MKIVEAMDYGYALLEDGSILKPDGTIITAEAYAELQKRQQSNRLDWQDIDAREFLDLIKNADWKAKIAEKQDGDIESMAILAIDPEGEHIFSAHKLSWERIATNSHLSTGAASSTSSRETDLICLTTLRPTLRISSERLNKTGASIRLMMRLLI